MCGKGERFEHDWAGTSRIAKAQEWGLNPLSTIEPECVRSPNGRAKGGKDRGRRSSLQETNGALVLGVGDDVGQ
jgi:hypothetical protein